MISHFQIACKSFKNINMTSMEKNMQALPKLVDLNLLKGPINMNETTLVRLVSGCLKTLKSFKINYGCHGFGSQFIVTLAKCRQLKTLQLGEYDEYHNFNSSQKVDKLSLVRKLMQHRLF